jgi:hypothetical protein
MEYHFLFLYYNIFVTQRPMRSRYAFLRSTNLFVYHIDSCISKKSVICLLAVNTKSGIQYAAYR